MYVLSFNIITTTEITTSQIFCKINETKINYITCYVIDNTKKIQINSSEHKSSIFQGRKMAIIKRWEAKMVSPSTTADSIFSAVFKHIVTGLKLICFKLICKYFIKE